MAVFGYTSVGGTAVSNENIVTYHGDAPDSDGTVTSGHAYLAITTAAKDNSMALYGYDIANDNMEALLDRFLILLSYP